MNRIILVTGGNRGIGLAIVTGLAKNPDDTVLLGSRNLKDGEKEAAKLPKNVSAVKMDIGTPQSLVTDIKAILKQHGKVDVLVNNAGILHDGGLLEADVQKVQESLQVNTLAPLHLIRAVAPGMQERKYGRIVNLSSGYGAFNEGLAGPFVYSLTKAALNVISNVAGRELGDNIIVNSMCPGWVRTRMGTMEATRSAKEGAETAIWLANLPAGSPSGRFFRDKKEIAW